ncbi:MAG: diacylglycerol kinase [Pedobacter sp.]|nr:MAG: diacylglycerol kinase [Pedobacter sp.]
MKKRKINVRLIHNPGAGTDEKYKKENLIEIIEAYNYHCEYTSSKSQALKDISAATDFIAIAGGDGTVRKTIMDLLEQKLKSKRPIAILPLGTANNIATSLGLSADIKKNIGHWSDYKLKKFDVGQVTGFNNDAYFIESFGFGLFPKLMQELESKNTEKADSPNDEFKNALKTLLSITEDYKPVKLYVQTNDKVIEKQCLLFEVMNISSLGPKLTLSKDADPGDGYFDMVIVEADQKELLQKYLIQYLNSEEPEFPIKPVKVKSLQIQWDGSDVHADDEIVKGYKGEELHISLLNSLIEIVI